MKNMSSAQRVQVVDPHGMRAVDAYGVRVIDGDGTGDVSMLMEYGQSMSAGSVSSVFSGSGSSFFWCC